MNIITSFFKHQSAHYWSRYKWLEDWKKEILDNIKNPKIVDLGAGHRPMWDATHLVEMYIDDNTQRARSFKAGSRVVINSNIEKIPVENKTFDLSYARHVLEHVDDPEKACKEIMRVSRQGFIETPHPFLEIGYGFPKKERGWSFHKWYVWTDNTNTLFFRRKTEKNINDFCDCLYGAYAYQIFDHYKPDLNQYLNKMPYWLKNTKFIWRDKFKFKIIDK